MSTDDGRTTSDPGDAVERAAARLGNELGGTWDHERAGARSTTTDGETGQRAGAGPDASSTGAGERSGRADRLEQLLIHQATAGQRPYLEAVPSGYAAESVVFDWLAFLVDRAGYRATLDALRYYRSVGWLTERAEDQLAEYLRGFPAPPAGESLDVDDHQQSLVFVAKLASLD
ncbi:flagella E [Salinirubellus salinus]|uniref:Flagella E n=1 Tax=Salinirubellus salinus TaxID=1364945 RepID=A0A9E7QZS2_9EURY|nr:FlaD/FlaE family flagellar protein [Salinirubellus salinus]UWM52992.1 flagella E [Salinirubellus salinus]